MRGRGINAGTDGTFPIFRLRNWGQSRLSPVYPARFTPPGLPRPVYPGLPQYDLSGGQGTSQQMNVTAREFAYATNDNPSNACSLTYGTDRTYTYTVYTHPDHAALASTDQLGGTLVTEGFNSPPCATTGNGAVNSAGQFTDRVRYCSSTPLTCSGAFIQTLKVAGYSVRTNTLTFSNSGVAYTSDGPTQ
jgi:hypothetical protein